MRVRRWWVLFEEAAQMFATIVTDKPLFVFLIFASVGSDCLYQTADQQPKDARATFCAP